MASSNDSSEQNTDNESNTLHDHPGRRSRLLPEYLAQFLNLLKNNGNVSLSARIVNRSRSSIYQFANENPDFKEAMRDAIKEGRELLIGEGWKQATTWTEHTDSKGGLHVRAPDGATLRMLISGYFQMFKAGRDTEPELVDEIIPESADLTTLSKTELDTLEGLLAKLGGDVNAVTS